MTTDIYSVVRQCTKCGDRATYGPNAKHCDLCGGLLKKWAR